MGVQQSRWPDPRRRRHCQLRTPGRADSQSCRSRFGGRKMQMRNILPVAQIAVIGTSQLWTSALAYTDSNLCLFLSKPHRAFCSNQVCKDSRILLGGLKNRVPKFFSTPFAHRFFSRGSELSRHYQVSDYILERNEKRKQENLEIAERLRGSALKLL